MVRDLEFGPPKTVDENEKVAEAIRDRHMLSDQLAVEWDRSEEKKQFFKSVKWSSLIIGGALAVYLLVMASTMQYEVRNYPLNLIASPSLAVVSGTAYIQFIRYVARRGAFKRRFMLDLVQGRVAAAEEKVATNEDLGLSGLWVAAQKRLGYYHEIALGQSKISFISGQVAAGLGFFLLLVATLASVVSSRPGTALVAGGIGTVGAALAGYIGRTFIRTQETAGAQLRSYFLQPLEVSRYLAAERLLLNLPEEERAETVKQIILGIMRNPITPNTLPAKKNKTRGRVRSRGKKEPSPE